MHGIVDEKTDVFAFGVLLLEVISGRKPVDGSHQSLHTWVLLLRVINLSLHKIWKSNELFMCELIGIAQAKPILKKGEIEKVVDPRLEGAYDVTELTTLAFAASLCVRSSSTWRPTMTQVPQSFIYNIIHTTFSNL